MGPSLALKQPHLPTPVSHESLHLSQSVMGSCVTSLGQLPLSHREPPRGLEGKGRLAGLEAKVPLARLALGLGLKFSDTLECVNVTHVTATLASTGFSLTE